MTEIRPNSSEDMVNHPAHYEKECSIECFDAIVTAFGPENTLYYCAGNVFKYLWRHKFKNGNEDLDKARWYLNKLRELSEYCEGHTELPYDTDLFTRVQYLYRKASGIYGGTEKIDS